MIGSLRENQKLQTLHRIVICGFFSWKDRGTGRKRQKHQYCAWGLLTPFPLTVIEPTIHFKPTWRHVSWCATRTTEMDSDGPQPRPPPWPKLQQRRGCHPLPPNPPCPWVWVWGIWASGSSCSSQFRGGPSCCCLDSDSHHSLAFTHSLTLSLSLSPSLSWQRFVLCSGITHRWDHEMYKLP